MNEPGKHEAHTATKLVVRVLQDVVSRDRFATYADLAEALKVQCRRWKIPYDSKLVSDAIDRLEMGGKVRIVAGPVPEVKSAPLPVAMPCSRSEAAVLYAQIVKQFTPAPASPPVVPGAPEFFPSLVRVGS